jgi:aphidicolan-16beta-ol synthase/syn-copalyl-diphosphate synthase
LTLDPCVAPDADDTAKTLTALHLLGYPGPYDTLIEKFEMETCFRSDATDRTPSFCANCNVLLALLHAPSPKRYLSQIVKCVRYICYTWWNTDEPIIDKWVTAICGGTDIRIYHRYTPRCSRRRV